MRNEGLNIKPDPDSSSEVDLEIEAPGAANSVAEEGAKTIQTETEFEGLVKQLKDARAKPENKLGEGGFLIALKDPKSFENSMRVVVLPNPQSESGIQAQKFDTNDQV